MIWQITQYRKCLEPARYLSEVTAWHGHIPFALWLMEVMRPNLFVELGVYAGDSYMAWCQGEPTAAMGIDTFEGDEHTGTVETDLYGQLKPVHDSLYSKFSFLRKARFEDAINEFYDKSIDLLHIDGCHSYAAVSRDFDTWLPKMSDSGVIVMHDTAVTSIPGFGVFQKWDEISKNYPTFDFFHYAGLGMALVGKDQHPLLAAMCTANGKEEGVWIRDFFQILARRIHYQRANRGSN